MFSLSQLQILHELGVGTFAKVYLVQHSVSSKLYAMKGYEL